MATKSFFEQMYTAFKQRTRMYVYSKVGTVISFTESTNVVVLVAKVKTDASGVGTLDYSGMKLLEVLDVVLQPVSATVNAADKIDCALVGDPTLTTLNFKTWKPALVVLGAVALQASASTNVYVTIRGRIAEGT